MAAAGHRAVAVGLVALVVVAAVVVAPGPQPGFGEVAVATEEAVAIPPGDPGPLRNERHYDDFFETAVAADVAQVVWLRPVRIGTEPKYYDPSYVDGSQEIVEGIVRGEAAEHPDQVEVLDFRAWFETTPYPTDLNVRPDGVHLVPEVAEEVAVDWLGPQLTDLVLGKP